MCSRALPPSGQKPVDAGGARAYGPAVMNEYAKLDLLTGALLLGSAAVGP